MTTNGQAAVTPAVRTAEPDLAGARVLVTGGAGFIGRHLANVLSAAGAELWLIDEHPAAFTGPARNGRSPAVHQGSVGTTRFLRFLERQGPFDYIFHLAGRAFAAGSVAAPRLDFAANLVASVQLLEQLRTLRWSSRLVFASSAAVYGAPEKLPMCESDATVPMSPYGVSKLAAERYVAVYARLYGLPASSLRLFSVYGPHQTKQVVYDLLVKLRTWPGRLTVLGDGSEVRDLVYVEDVVDAFVVAATQGRTDGPAYNVATGTGTSIAELARLIVDVQDPGAIISFTGEARPGDPPRWLGNSAALRKLGWQPRYVVRDGLQATARWFNTTPAPSIVEVPH